MAKKTYTASRSKHGLTVLSSADAASYVPNFAGMPLKTASQESNVSYFPQRWQSPLLSWTNYYIPWDRATLYQWIRHYDTFHPIIGSCIDLHAQLPLSRFGLRGISDPKVLAFYEEMMDELDAYILMYGMLREWWLIGEVFVYLVWDDNMKMFTRARVLPPEYVQVKGHSLVTGSEDAYDYYLIPDDELKIFVENAKDEASEAKKEQLPPEVLEAIEEGKNIRINPFNLMTMIRKQSEYNPRGTSLVLRCLKDLLYEDKLREAQYAIADRLVLPKEIWKIGNEKYLPSEGKLKSFAELVRTLEDMPKFNLVTNYTVNYEVIGAVGKFPNLASEFDWVEKRILTGMFCYDEQTEVLTNNGFKYYDDVIDDDLIMCYDKDTNELQYGKFEERRKWWYEGDMYNFNGQRMDICVTPEHRMLTVEPDKQVRIQKNAYKGKTYKKHHLEAKKLNDQWNWDVKFAKDIKKFSRFRTVGKWNPVPSMVIPHDGFDFDGVKISVADYLKIGAWYVSEGWLIHCKKDYERTDDVCTLCIAQKKHWKYLKTFFDKFPFEKTYEKRKSGCNTVKIMNKSLAMRLKNDFGEYSHHKKINQWIMNLPIDLLQIFLNEVLMGDGSVQKNYFKGDSRYYTYGTTSKMLADNVQEIAFKCGYSPALGFYNNIYIVRWSDTDNNKFPTLTKNPIVTDYAGYVWCFKVPTHFFVTRRNGKIAIQGNTNKALTTGEGPTYQNASVAMRALLSRYLEARARLESAWVQSIFMPTAIVNEFYKVTPAELEHKIKKPLKDREPLLPEFDWRYKTNLLDDASYRESLLRLRDKKVLPMKTILEALGLDYDTTQRWLEDEKGTIFDPDFEEVYKKKLLEEGINPEDAPALLSTETQKKPGSKIADVTEEIKENLTEQEKKERRMLEKGDPKLKDLKEEEGDIKKLPRKTWTWGSRGDILRKVDAVKMLLKRRHDIKPLHEMEMKFPDKAGSLIRDRDNIQKVPKELEKQMEKKRDIIVASFKMNKRNKK